MLSERTLTLRRCCDGLIDHFTERTQAQNAVGEEQATPAPVAAAEAAAAAAPEIDRPRLPREVGSVGPSRCCSRAKSDQVAMKLGRTPRLFTMIG